MKKLNTHTMNYKLLSNSLKGIFLSSKKTLLLFMSFFAISFGYSAMNAFNDIATTNANTTVTFSITTNDNTTSGNIDFSSIDFDLGIPGVQTIYSSSNGSIQIDNLGNATYTPNLNFNGTENFNYNICNDLGIPECSSASITITINPINTMPICGSDNATTPFNTSIIINVLSNDNDNADPLGNIDPTTVLIETAPANGFTATNPSTGEITYTPNLNFSGTDIFNYSVCDDGNPLPALCCTTSVTITVSPASNTAPIAVDDNVSTLKNIPVSVDVTTNDTDNSSVDITSVTITSATSSNGIITLDNATGIITFVPNNNFIGTEIITYSICDDGNPGSTVLCSTTDGILTITVTPINITGAVKSSTNVGLQNSTVYLIEYITSLNSVIISQTTTTDALGVYSFSNVPSTFYIKAIPDAILYPNDVPTYYSNSAVYQFATAINPTTQNYMVNFATQAGINLGGAGFIAGNVASGAGKNNAEGDPVDNLSIVLKDANQQIVAQTITDAQGYFEFDNLAEEDFTIWVDNYTVDNANAPLISLGTDNNQDNLKFKLFEDRLEKTEDATAIQNISESSFTVFPNPTRGVLNINTSEFNYSYEIQIIDIMGKVVYSNTFNNNQSSISLKESDLTNGTYFLKIKTEKESYFSKVVLR